MEQMRFIGTSRTVEIGKFGPINSITAGQKIRLKYSHIMIPDDQVPLIRSPFWGGSVLDYTRQSGSQKQAASCEMRYL